LTFTRVQKYIQDTQPWLFIQHAATRRCIALGGGTMKLLDQIRHGLRVKHFALATEKAYVYWAERYIRFHGIRHPRTLGTPEIERFLTHLAVAEHVSASTQNQALGALLFLYRDVLQMEVGNLDAVRARRAQRVPTVLSTAEVQRLLAALSA